MHPRSEMPLNCLDKCIDEHGIEYEATLAITLFYIYIQRRNIIELVYRSLHNDAHLQCVTY